MKLSAYNNRDRHKYSFNFNMRMGDRLDNSYDCDRFMAACCYYLNPSKFADSGTLSLYRESRKNYLSFFNQEAQNSHKHSLSAPDNNLPKQSNLFGLAYRIKKSIFTINGGVGMDVSNESYFKTLNAKAAKDFNLNDTFRLTLGVEGAKMWGNNIHREDMLKRHISQWPGSRSTNYISTGFRLQFKQFPYLSLISWSPYLYGQSWAIFSPN